MMSFFSSLYLIYNFVAVLLEATLFCGLSIRFDFKSVL